MSPAIRCGLFTLVYSVAISPIHAQPAAPGETIVLPEIVVQTPGSLTVPSVAAQHAAIDRTVGSIGFVDASTPAQKTRVKQDLRDALKDVPGVFVQSRYGQELRLSVRGSGIARGYHLRGIELLQDGIPVNMADGSGDSYQIDPLAFRTIEVFKGGNALTFGATTLGGAINAVTPTAYTTEAPNVVEIDGGSYGTARVNAQASRIVGPWDFLVNATVTHADGFRDHERSNYQQLNGNLGYRIVPGVETRFYWGVYNTAQQLPGTLTLSDALTRPTIASKATLAGNQSREVTAERIANRTSFALEAGQLDIDSWFINKHLFHPIFQVIDQDGFTAGLAPHLTTSTRIVGHHDELIVGARAIGGRNAARQFVNVAGNATTPTLNAGQDAVNLEVYAENRFFILPNVGVMTGAKAFADTRRYRDFGGLAADPTPKADSVTYTGINPKIGLIWLPKPDVQVFADVTRSRDVPDFTDLTQTTATTTQFVPLAAQKAWTFEAGTRGRVDRVTFDVTAYRSEVRDELLQFTTNQSIPASTFNADRTRHQGIEFGAGVDLFRHLLAPDSDDAMTVTQVWTHSDFRFVGDAQYGNNRIAGVPDDVLRTTVSYHNGGFYIAPSVDWVPHGAFADYANTLRVPGYVLVGLQVGLPLAPGMTLSVDARNLTDQRYVSDLSTITDARVASTAVFYPGNGRSVFASLRYAF